MKSNITINNIGFSVIIPLYNKELSIKSTIKSVLAQTFRNFELLIINDGSTDNSFSVAESITDTRIRIINKKNGGVSSARNFGIQASKNEYIAFLDADDYWFPNCLEEFAKLIVKYTEAKVFCTGHMLTGHHNPGTNKSYYLNDLHMATAIAMAKYTYAAVCTGCITISKKCFIKSGLFDENLSHGEDTDMWFRLSDIYLFAKTEVVTMEYRIQAENRATNISLTHRKVKLIDKFPIRSGFNSKSKQILFGSECFFEILSNLRSRSNFLISLKLLLNYGDWITLFVILIFKYRLLHLKS